jgi:hypothetical protein
MLYMYYTHTHTHTRTEGERERETDGQTHTHTHIPHLGRPSEEGHGIDIGVAICCTRHGLYQIRNSMVRVVLVHPPRNLNVCKCVCVCLFIQILRER